MIFEDIFGWCPSVPNLMIYLACTVLLPCLYCTSTLLVLYFLACTDDVPDSYCASLLVLRMSNVEISTI